MKHTLPSLIADESFPRTSSEAALQKGSKPSTGKYSWLLLVSSAIFFSASLTTGNTHGLPSSVRYAEIRHHW